MNAAMTALRFFFKVTLRRVTSPKTSCSPASPGGCRWAVLEVGRSGPAVGGGSRRNRYKAALSIAYGTGLRASRLFSLKVGDIDNARMLIRVDQGKGHKDRYVMLLQQLLELLRQWWRIARPRYWLFPGQVPGEPLYHAATQPGCPRNGGASGRGLISAWGFTPCGTLRHASARTEDRHPCHSGTARAQEARHHGALYPCRHIKAIGEVTSPLDLAAHRGVRPPA